MAPQKLEIVSHSRSFLKDLDELGEEFESRVLRNRLYMQCATVHAHVSPEAALYRCQGQSCLDLLHAYGLHGVNLSDVRARFL
jgi:hypothetical protein